MLMCFSCLWRRRHVARTAVEQPFDQVVVNLRTEVVDLGFDLDQLVSVVGLRAVAR
jgi:hypothetical protein